MKLSSEETLQHSIVQAWNQMEQSESAKSNAKCISISVVLLLNKAKTSVT